LQQTNSRADSLPVERSSSCPRTEVPSFIMAGLLVVFRFCVFLIFIICNAIICSVGVWNISFAESAGLNHQISAYLIFLGAFCLLCGFPILFIDLIRKNAITSRIWFECTWVGLFWVMELSAAAAVSADMSDVMCSAHVQQSMMGACTSTRVLMAFTWICTGTLLIYLVVLTSCAMFHQSFDTQVWHATARDFAWFSTRSSLESVPASPVKDKQELPTMAAPQPRHPMPRISSEPWELNSREAAVHPVQRPPQVHESTFTRQAYVPAACPPTVPAEPPRANKPLQLSKPSMIPSLYPEHMSSVIPLSARSSLLRQSIQADPTPPPLGDWLRKSASDQRTRRKQPQPALHHTSSLVVQSSPPAARETSVRHPVGPRHGPQGQRRRPPPLNFDRISSVRK
jgi:hypothetical protein